MNIGIVSFKNANTEKAIIEFLERYKDEDIRILLPVTSEDQVFVQSVLKACVENQVHVVCFIAHAAGLEHLLQQANEIVVAENPLQEVIHQLGTDDALGISWDDSLPAHTLLHSVEDLALDVWDITDGIDPIEIDDGEYATEDLHEIMHTSLGMFVDALTAFVASVVMDSLTEAVAEKIRESDDQKDVSPFDDME
jgi:hypothetical protein